MRKRLIAAAGAVLGLTGCAESGADDAVTAGQHADSRRTEIWECSDSAGAHPSGGPTAKLTGTLWAATGTITVPGSPTELTDFGIVGPVRVWSWGDPSMRTSQFHIGPDLTGLHVRFPDGRRTARPASLHRCRLVRRA